MHTHPHLLGDLATDRGRVRQAEAARERQLAQVRTGTGGLRVAPKPLATALVVLTTALALVTAAVAAPQENKTTKVDAVNAANYFVQHPGSAGGQTEIDPFDPYAPVDTGTVLSSVGFTSVAGVTTERSRYARWGGIEP